MQPKGKAKGRNADSGQAVGKPHPDRGFCEFCWKSGHSLKKCRSALAYFAGVAQQAATKPKGKDKAAVQSVQVPLRLNNSSPNHRPTSTSS